ncbi:MAG: hypothetical protein AB7O97_01660 [Planctomycetota bacterium]
MRSLSVCILAAACGANVAAQQIAVPALFAAAEGGSTPNLWRAGINRYQCVYDTGNFLAQELGHPIDVDTVEFRLAGGLTGALVTYPSVELYLEPAAADHLAMSATFAANRTLPQPRTPEFAGPVTVTAAGGGTPNDWVVSIPLAAPFRYVPDAGADLLLELVILAAPTPLAGNTFSTGFNAALHGCNALRSVGSVTAVTGTPTAFCPVVRLGYTEAPGAARADGFGRGCYDRASSFYEQFAGGANDLSGRTLTLAPNTSGGYTVTAQGGALLVPPTTTGLALGDDQLSAAIALPFAFDFPGGSTGAIVVDANGSVVLAGAASGSSIGGSAAAMLRLDGPRLCPSLQDLLPDGAVNAQNVFAEIDPGDPATFLITWWNVPCFGGTGTSTFQVALVDRAAGDTCEFRFATLTNDSTSNGGVAVTGWTPGFAAVDPGGSDLSGPRPIVTVAEARALLHRVSPRPILGSTCDSITDHVPPGAPFSLHLLGTVAVTPGPDLAVLGAPNCFQAIDGVVHSFLLAAPLPRQQIALNVPNDPFLIGGELMSQSAVFAPGVNAFGLLTSNAVRLRFGTL